MKLFPFPYRLLSQYAHTVSVSGVSVSPEPERLRGFLLLVPHLPPKSRRTPRRHNLRIRVGNSANKRDWFRNGPNRTKTARYWDAPLSLEWSCPCGSAKREPPERAWVIGMERRRVPRPFRTQIQPIELMLRTPRPVRHISSKVAY